MSSIVVDASVVVKLLVEQPDSADAESVLEPGIWRYAPEFLHIEVANALWAYARKKLISAELYKNLLHRSFGFEIQTQRDHDLLASASALAVEYEHPVYDCLYLALAISRGAQLVTADKRFCNRFASSQHASSMVMLAQYAHSQSARP